MVKVSIIIGVYNGGKTLNRAIDSLMNQTFQDFEIVLCDDNSKDNSREIIETYKNQFPTKVKCVFNETNMTLAGALNQCLAVAEGEYIARMDQDDFSYIERLEKQVQFLNLHPEIACLGSAITVDDGTNTQTSRHCPAIPTLNILLKGGYAFFHPVIMIRKSILDQLGGYRNDPSCNLCEDLDLWYRFFIAGYQGANLEELLLLYAESQNDFTKRKFERGLLVFKLRSHYRKVCKKSVFWNVYYLKSLLFSLMPAKVKYRVKSVVK